LETVSEDFFEPLAESALLARQWAQSSCHDDGENPGCGWYHGSWQVLRLLGVFNSIRSDDDFIFRELDKALGNGATRFLISGAADYALLARITKSASRHKVTPEITVVDQCETPLKLNRWYARRKGLDIHTQQTNILRYENPGRFDLVCTHSFLCYFDQAQRSRLAAVWWACLADGGAILTAQRTRPHDTESRIAYTPQQARALGDRAFYLAEEQFGQLGIDPQLSRELALGYATNHWTHLIRHPGELKRLFQNQGFVFEHFAPPDERQFVSDTPGTPNLADTCRWRILARKPTR
jgi:hypothetical protein